MFATAKQFIRSVLRPPLHQADVVLPYDMFGDEHCAWPLSLPDSAAGALIFSFGIGENISFDLAAIEVLGCRVHGFDPTPRSRAWLQTQNLPAEFTFHPIGIAGRDDQVEFFPPENAEHVSFSAAPARPGSNASPIKADVMRLRSLVDRVGTGMPDIVKLDIEGFEYEVLSNLVSEEILPKQVLVEFHHGKYGIDSSQTRKAVASMIAAHYRIFYVSANGHEYGFIHMAGC